MLIVDLTIVSICLLIIFVVIINYKGIQKSIAGYIIVFVILSVALADIYFVSRGYYG